MIADSFRNGRLGSVAIFVMACLLVVFTVVVDSQYTEWSLATEALPSTLINGEPWDAVFVNDTHFYASMGVAEDTTNNIKFMRLINGGQSAQRVLGWSSSTVVPGQLAFINNTLHVADWSSRSQSYQRRFSPVGALLDTRTLGYESESVTFDSAGRMYKCEGSLGFDSVIFIYDQQGVLLDTITHPDLDRCTKLLFDPRTNYLFAGTVLHAFLRFVVNPNGTVSFVDLFATEGTNAGQVDGVGGMALDSDGNLYVADIGNERITKFNTTTAEVLGIIDGPSLGLVQPLNDPYCVAVNNQYMLICDIGDVQTNRPNRMLVLRKTGTTTGVLSTTSAPTTTTQRTGGGAVITQTESTAPDNSSTVLAIVLVVVIVVIVVFAIVVLVLIVRRRRGDDGRVKQSEPHYVGMAAQNADLATKDLILSDVVVGEKIGGGEFGEVYRGRWQGSDVALKRLKNIVQQQDFIKEISILSKLKHPKIVYFMGVFTDKDGSQFMVMEFISKGSLQDVLRDYAMNDKKLPLLALLTFCRDAASGMEYLESKEIVHRDLALRNLLVESKGGNEFTVKITDFGMARLTSIYQSATVTPAASINGEVPNNIPVKWCSPEVLQFGTYSHKSDVWAYGITSWEIFSYGTQPYPGLSNSETINRVVVQKYRLPRPSDMPEIIYDVCQLTWSVKPERRPAFSTINAQVEDAMAQAPLLERQLGVDLQASMIKQPAAMKRQSGVPGVDDVATYNTNDKRATRELEPLYNTKNDSTYADPSMQNPTYFGEGTQSQQRASLAVGSQQSGEQPTYTDVGTPKTQSAQSSVQPQGPQQDYIDVGTQPVVAHEAKKWEIPFNQLEFGAEVGNGSYGTVYKGRWRESDVAIKRIRGADVSGKNYADFISEANLMMSIRPHENVVLLKGICLNPLCIVTQYLPGGTLDQLVKEKAMDYAVLLQISLGVAKGLHHLHCEGVVHRDVAARNILLHVVKTGFEPKITDFGSSRWAVAEENTTRSDVGPLKWMAPESISQKVYSFKSDVWSFGCLLVESFDRGKLYAGEDALQVALAVSQNNKKPVVPSGVDASLAQLIQSCFQFDFNQRPVMESLVMSLQQIVKNNPVAPTHQ